VDEGGLGSYLMVGFGISGVESSGSATRELLPIAEFKCTDIVTLATVPSLN
jgi:hypothetical protein